MKMFILAMLLAVVQTPPPVPRQTSNTGASNSAEAQDQADNQQKPTNSTPEVVGKKQPPTTETHPQQQGDKNADQSVRITEFPAVSIRDNGFNWQGWISNALLLIVSLLQIYILFRTLKATEIAAEAARTSSNVAETTMKIIEAPDLLLDNVGLVPTRAITPDSYVSMHVKNFGGSRAKNAQSFVKLIIPEVPDTELSNETFSVGRGGTQMIRFLAFKETLNQETFRKIVRGEISVRFSGNITYEDVFGEKYILECKGILDAKTGTFASGDTDPKKR